VRSQSEIIAPFTQRGGGSDGRTDRQTDRLHFADSEKEEKKWIFDKSFGGARYKHFRRFFLDKREYEWENRVD
jgi:hypothetical protein